MKPEEQQVAIARLQGKRTDRPSSGCHDLGCECRECYPLPDYLNDLNAIHEAEKVLATTGNWLKYVKELGMIFMRDLNGFSTWEIHCQRTEQGVQHGIINFVQATAAQRAEALLKTLNLWTE